MRRRIEREAPEKLTVRMWLYPYLTWATIGLIVFVIGYMFTDADGRVQMILSLAVAAVVLAASLVKDRIVRQRGEPLPGAPGTAVPSGEDGGGPDAAAAARVPRPAGEADPQTTRR